MINFKQVGPVISPDKLVRLPYQKAERLGDVVKGIIPVLDIQYGNVWSNIPKDLFDQLGIAIGDQVKVRVFHQDKLIDEITAPYRNTFGEVPIGKPLVYVNSLINLAVAINLGSYAEEHKIDSGLDWFIELGKVNP